MVWRRETPYSRITETLEERDRDHLGGRERKGQQQSMLYLKCMADKQKKSSLLAEAMHSNQNQKPSNSHKHQEEDFRATHLKENKEVVKKNLTS